jgi:Tfp pilus assembly protein PilN
MIRINLLGAAKARKGKRTALPIPDETIGEGGGLSSVLLVLLILAATAVGNGMWYLALTANAKEIREQTAKESAEFAHLSQVKQSYQELEKQEDAYKKRVDVITGLQAKQDGPAKLLTTLGETVNRTDEVWLSNMSDDGTNVNLKGTALSIHGVANLMRNLKNTGFFKDVEIKSSYQDEGVRDMQAFVFEIVCHRPQPSSAQPKS